MRMRMAYTPAMSASPTLSISVVIPVRDHTALLQTLLAGIREHAPEQLLHEIIVVDDGSKQPIAPSLESFDVRVLRLPESKGPANARNTGAAEATGEVLFLFDADVEYAPGAFEKAAEILAAHPEIGAVSFLNQPYDPKASAAANFCAAIERQFHQPVVDSGAAFTDCLGCTTRSTAIRREIYEQIRGFDPAFKTNAHEDYDFGKRLAYTTRTVITPEPVLYHNFPATLRRVLRNYWVRIRLWVPYFLRHRPPMDTMQISPGEARLRLMAAAAPGLLIVSALPLPLPWWARGCMAAGALALLGGYAWGVRAFVRVAYKVSASPVFALQALGIHLLTAWVITLGGCWGLAQFALGQGQHELRSPVR